MIEKKRAMPEVKPSNAVLIEALFKEDSLMRGTALNSDQAKASPVEALGDRLANFEDALICGDAKLALNAAIDIAWLARACGLRRGDSGCDILRAYPPAK